MNILGNHFFYEKRYSTPGFKDKYELFSERIKFILAKFGRSSRIFRLFFPRDIFLLKSDSDVIGSTTDPTNTDIRLSAITFLLPLEIDDFDLYKEKIVKHFAKSSWHFGPHNRDRLQETLNSVKSSFNTTSYGGQPFYLKFDRKKHNNLLDAALIGYTKTLESYFILNVEIRPSTLFHETLRSIVTSPDFTLENVVFNRFLEIIKRRQFVSHSNMNLSANTESINNLISDLEYQVKSNVLGPFLNSDDHTRHLPRVEIFETTSLDTANLEFSIPRWIGRHKSSFRFNDGKIHIFKHAGDSNCIIKILKESGHGKRDANKSDLTDYDWVENYNLFKALALPTALHSILVRQQKSLDKLKRLVYDYIRDSAKKNFLNRIFSFNRTYIKLKLTFANHILTFKRFEGEFSTDNLRELYSDDMHLREFIRSKNSVVHQDESENLEKNFLSSFEYMIGKLNKEINTLTEVFEPIEGINTYRISIWLQIASLITAVLSLLLAEQFIKWLNG